MRIQDKESGHPYIDHFIDLHAHLDGAITVDIAKRLAEIQGTRLPAEDDEILKKLIQVPADCTSLNDFLKCFDLPCSLLQIKESIAEAVYLVLEDMRKDGVIYAEIMFAPQLHTANGLTQEEVVQAALEGLKRAEIPANLLLCIMRGEGNEAENEITLELAHKYLVEDGGVVGLNLAGAEALFPTKNYVDLFTKAKEWKIPFSIHAGEAAGAESVRTAIEMGASRIGHGVRAKEDADLLKLLCERKIPVEMCPTSNRQTKAVEDMSEYPMIEYLNAGIKVTINTDDPAIEGTKLSEEFSSMEKNFGLTKEQEKVLLENAVEAAFTSKERKQEMYEKFDN